jgi:exonuclease III/ribonuclease HI
VHQLVCLGDTHERTFGHSQYDVPVPEDSGPLKLCTPFGNGMILFHRTPHAQITCTHALSWDIPTHHADMEGNAQSKLSQAQDCQVCVRGEMPPEPHQAWDTSLHPSCVKGRKPPEHYLAQDTIHANQNCQGLPMLVRTFASSLYADKVRWSTILKHPIFQLLSCHYSSLLCPCCDRLNEQGAPSMRQQDEAEHCYLHSHQHMFPVHEYLKAIAKSAIMQRKDVVMNSHMLTDVLQLVQLASHGEAALKLIRNYTIKSCDGPQTIADTAKQSQNLTSPCKLIASEGNTKNSNLPGINPMQVSLNCQFHLQHPGINRKLRRIQQKICGEVNDTHHHDSRDSTLRIHYYLLQFAVPENSPIQVNLIPLFPFTKQIRIRHIRRRQAWPSWTTTSLHQLSNTTLQSKNINTNSEPMCASLIKILQMIAGIEPNPGPIPHLYHEKQERCFCAVHALNNSIGKQVTTGQHVIDFLQSISFSTTYIHEEYDPGNGDFSCRALNIWLYCHLTHPHMISTRQQDLSQHPPTTVWTLQKVEQMLDNKWESALIHHNNHWTAIRKYQHHWYLLDSLKPTPIQLDAHTQLQGNLLTLERLDAQAHGFLDLQFPQTYPAPPPYVTAYDSLMFAPNQYPVRYLHMQIDTHPSLPTPYHPDSIYLEPQESRYCGIHALNALFGQAIAKAENVSKYMDNITTQYPPFSIYYDHRNKTGNFSTQAINLWLRAHSTPMVALTKISQSIMNWTAAILDDLIEGVYDRVMIVDPGYHWVTIRKKNSRYILLDSMRPTPIILDRETWRLVKGIPLVLQNRDCMSANGMGYTCAPEWLASHPESEQTHPIHPYAVTIHAALPEPLPPWHDNGMGGDTTDQAIMFDSEEEDNPRAPPMERRNLPHPPLMHNTQSNKRVPHVTRPRHYSHIRDLIQKTTPRIVAANPLLPKQRIRKLNGTQQPITTFFPRRQQSATIHSTLDNHATKLQCSTQQENTKGTSSEATEPPRVPCPAALPTPNTENARPPSPTTITIFTLNVRGLSTGYTDMWEILHKQNPDIAILSETKLHSKQRRSFFLHSTCLPGYKIFVSCDDMFTKGSGIIIAIKSGIHKQGVFDVLKEHECPGYILPIRITLPFSEPLILVGAYVPNPDNSPNNTTCRRSNSISTLHNLLQHARDTKQQTIIAGDMNAATHIEDRLEAALTTIDKSWRSFLTKNALVSLPLRANCRDHTFRKGIDATPSSRIDDILYAGRYKDNDIVSEATTIDTVGTRLDHNAVLLSLKINNMNIVGPPKAQTQSREVKMLLERPIKPEDQKIFQTTVTAQLHDTISRLDKYLHDIMNQEIHPHMQTLAPNKADGPSNRLTTIAHSPARDWVEKHSKILTNILLEVQSIAMSTCPTRTQHTGGMYYRNRTMKKERRRLTQANCALMQARTKLRIATPQATNTQAKETSDKVSDLPKPIQDVIKLQLNQDEPSANAYKAIMQANFCLNKKLRQIDTDTLKISTQLERKRLQKLADIKQKIGNQMMTGSTISRQPLEALHDPVTNMPTTNTERILEIIEAYQKPYLIPPKGPKHGKYLPKDRPDPLYPWEDPMAPDQFKLESHSTAQGTRPWLHDKIFCYDAFAATLNSISSGKAPGPDTITNDLLKMLPFVLKQTLHKFMCILYATGITPEHWGESETALIYKGKNSPLTLDNYRPIGLVNTIGKLWTKFLTYVLSDFAESNGILGLHNAGFRRGKSTIKQILLTVNALEDARLTGQNIYLMQIDLTQAFNRIDHDLLLCTMYDLGFPTCIIDAVSGVYKNVKTSYKSENGKTHPMQINRGTLQGDSLSPFIFLIYIETLLRWLHYGGRGYRFGCLPNELERTKNQASNITFADDLNVMTSKACDLRIQAHKISLWCDWGSMTVNTSKSLTTGILHSATNKKQLGCKGPTDEQAIANQLKDIIIQGKSIASTSPTAPFKFLGVTLTMTLDWKPQRAIMLNKIKHKVSALITNDFATPSQRRRVINTCIRPMILYGMEVAPYNEATLAALDGLLTKAMKQSYGIMTSAPTAMAHSDILQFGMGCPSITIEYHQKCTAALVEANNDPYRDGIITRALLGKHIENLHKLELKNKIGEYPYAMTLRQLSCAHQSQIAIILQNQEQYITDACNLVQQLNTLRYDAYYVNVLTQLPQWIITTLAELGVTGIEDLLDKTRKQPTIIAASHLDKRFGKTLSAQRKALNVITTAMNRPLNHPLDPDEVKSMPSRDLEYNERTIHADHTDAIPQPNESLITTYFPIVTKSEIALLDAYDHALENLLGDDTPEDTITHTAPLATTCSEDSQATESTQALDTQEGTLAKRRRNEDRTYKATKTHGPSPTQQLPQTQHRRAKRPWAAACNTIDDHRRTKLAPIEYQAPLVTTHQHRKTRAALLFHSDNPLQVIPMLHGDHDVPEKIKGWTTAQPFPPKRARRQPIVNRTLIQSKYLVKWRDSIIPSWELPYYNATRYAPIHTAPLEENDPEWEDFVLCEYCDKKCSEQGNPMLICSTCLKGYHCHCVQIYTPPDKDYICNQCQERNTNEPPFPPDVNSWVRVKWPETWEPHENLLDEAHQQLIREYLRHNRYDSTQVYKEEAYIKQYDKNLTNLEKQGVHTQPQTPLETHIEATLKEKVHIHACTMQPHTDISPTNNIVIQKRMVEGMTEKHQHYHLHLACIYHNSGQCASTISIDRLEYLQDKYTKEPSHLPEDIMKLLQRHTDGYKHEKGASPFQAKHQWSPPLRVIRALQSHLGVYTDRITTPLTCDMDMTCNHTNYPEDTVFGALHGTYSTPWTGSSIATPIQTPTQMNEAIRWAYHSCAQIDEPTLTTLLLSTTGSCSSSYMKWLRTFPDQCHLLTTIPNKNFDYLPHDHWKGITYFPKRHKFDINVVLVGNKAGFLKYGPKTQSHWQALSDEIHGKARSIFQLPAYTNHLPYLPKAELANYGHAIPSIMLHCPKALTRLIKQRTPAQPTSQTSNSKQYNCSQPHDEAPNTPLRYDWTQFAYTDGSLIDDANANMPLLGSGIFIPNRGTNRIEPSHEKSIHINPLGIGITNTVNRAELVAILHTIQQGEQNIATDSACSLQLIRKTITSLWRLTNHVHYILLLSIRMALYKNPHKTIHLHKVKSHNGVIGNVKADHAAKQAAKLNDPGTGNESIPCIPDGNDPHKNIHWPHDATPDQQDQPKSRTEMANLNADLKRHMHEKHNLGYSNTQSIYFKSWRCILPIVNEKASNHFMTSTKATHTQRKYMIAYRTGTLPTNKMFNRFDPTHTNKCPLCKTHLDGGHHALSGCEIIAQNIGSLRHNAAGRLIMKAISKGSKGADLIMADVGRQSLMEEVGLGDIPHRIPDWMLQSTATDNYETPQISANSSQKYQTRPSDNQLEVATNLHADEQENESVTKLKQDIQQAANTLKTRFIPDGLLLINGTRKKISKDSEFAIIEIKYCSDTKPQEQKGQANRQHTQLRALLTHTWGCKVTLYTILLGVGGTIYKSMEDTMQALGVKDGAYNKLANDLNLIAAEYAERAMALRRFLIYTEHKNQGTPAHTSGGGPNNTHVENNYNAPIAPNDPPAPYHLQTKRAMQPSYRNGDPD